MNNLFESKSVGNVYHIISFDGLIRSLKNNELKKQKSRISTTRNARMNSFTGSSYTAWFKFELDGDKISERYKIKPVAKSTIELGWGGERKRVYFQEFEEEIQSSTLRPLDTYVKRLILIKEAIEYTKSSDWFTSNGGRSEFFKESNFPFMLEKLLEMLNSKGIELWVQDKSGIIKKDDEYIQSLLDYPIKKLYYGYCYYKKGHEKVNDTIFGSRETWTGITPRNPKMMEMVIGRTYDVKLLKEPLKNPKVSEDRIYYKMTFEIEREWQEGQILKDAKLVNYKPTDW